MKKSIILFDALLALTFGFTSCEMDNYDEPEARIIGKIVDQNGQPFQCAQGKGSVSLRITETSYANGDESIVVVPQDLNIKQDGTFENIHLFAGTYTVVPWQGAFFENDDESFAQTVQLKNGTTSEVNFTVTPYLSLEWVKEPYLDGADGKLKASFRFKRNSKTGYSQPDLLDCCMWISRTQYAGTEGDGNYTPNALKITANQEGQEIQLESKIAIKYSMTYWVRIGARCNDKYQKYNFTDIKEIKVTAIPQ